MTSVRESLNVVGQSVSIKQVAHQCNASFPLSLRNFVGALPPGRVLRKVISLDFLQRKFMEFSSHNGLIDLVGFMDEVEQAINSATITSVGLNQVMLTVHFRGEVIWLNGQDPSSIKGLVKGG